MLNKCLINVYKSEKKYENLYLYCDVPLPKFFLSFP